MISPFWVLAGFCITYTYFSIVYKLERRTSKFSKTKFEKKLFMYGFAVRLLSVILLVIIAKVTWGKPFYVGAIDATRYYRVGGEVAYLILNGGWSDIYSHLMTEYTGHVDIIGVPFVLGILYAFTTQSVVIAKIFIAFIGSLSVLLIYRIASLIFDQPTARLAGLLAAFMPLSLFYDAVILKESFVVFLSSLSIYLSIRIRVTGKITVTRVFSLSAAIAAMFFFRTAAGAVIVVSLTVFFLANHVKRSPILSWTVGGVILILFFAFLNKTGQMDYYLQRLESGVEHGERRISKVESVTSWQNLALFPVFLPLSHFAPFPSMVDLNPWLGHHASYYWIGGIVAWNILAFVTLMGLWHMVRHKNRLTIMIWGFVVGYTLVLGITGMFTQVRLSWNIIPLMMIPAAVGFKHYRNVKPFYLALVSAGFLIIAWNIFRGIGRGVL